MTPETSPVSGSTNNARLMRKRRSGRRLVLWLFFLAILIVYLMWTENLEPSQLLDDSLFSTKKSVFLENGPPVMDGRLQSKRKKSRTIHASHGKIRTQKVQKQSAMAYDDDLFKLKAWNKINIFQKSTKSNGLEQTHPLRQTKIHSSQFDNSMAAPGSSIRRQNSIGESQKSNRIKKVDDTIPMAAVGSVMHAADSLLCRESVMDFVINATDLKDECDGLKKAYTQTCSADEDPEDEQSPSTRKLIEAFEYTPKFNGVLYWRSRLLRWSRAASDWWFYPSPDLGEEVVLFDVTVEDLGGTRLLEEFNVDERLEFSFDNIRDDDVDGGTQDTDGKNANWVHSIFTQVNPLDMHRKIKKVDRSDDRLAENSNDRETASLQLSDPPLVSKNATKSKESSPKKPLANLALPTKSKHVSDKMLSETLMLQQDTKLMKAVANQTNHTITEAQADAAASSKAVADAADMISNVLNDPNYIEAKQCCTSILNVFHDSCTVDEDEELSDRRLLVGVAVIAVCGWIKTLIRNFQIRWLPEAAGCIMVGVAAGYILTFYPHHDISFDGKWFLRIMVPPIVFEAALSIDKRSFSRHIVPILFYAVLGTLIATGVTAVVVSEGSKLFRCETIPYAEGLAFGALISSIDPIAVLSVLSNMGMTDQDTIYVVIFGESLLNDGVAIVLFETLVHFLDENMQVDGHAITAAAIHFLVVFVGSLLIGIASGMCCTLYFWMMHGCQTPIVEILMFLCWALLPYYVCDEIQWSGIVAVVAVGFIMDLFVVGTEKSGEHENYESDSEHDSEFDKLKDRRGRSKVRRPIFSKEGLLSKEATTHISFVTEIIATMMETAIFAYLGLFLFSSRYHWNFNHIVISIFGCCLSRAIMVPSLSLTANWITKFQQSGPLCRFQENSQQSSHQPETPMHRSNHAAGVVIDPKMQLVLWFAGLRGAMSFALVEHIPLYDSFSGEGTRLKSELKAMTSACIIFTVFVLGGGTYYMMQALGLSPKSSVENGSRETELVSLLGSGMVENVEDGSESEHMAVEHQNGEEIISRKASINSLRRPGKPVRRQRNRGKNHNI